MLYPKCDLNSHFTDLNNTYDLSNLVKSVTCFKCSKGTHLNVLLTSKPKGFQKSFLCETGLIDCHKLVAIIFRSTFTKFLPKVVKYGSYKNFKEGKFYHDLD